MDVKNSTVLILGGAGLVGQSVARRLLREGPRRVVIGALYREDAEATVEEFREAGRSRGVRIDAVWGDLFVLDSMRERPRSEILEDAESRTSLVDDLYSELTDEVFRRSALGTLLLDVRPDIVVDCINTAGALAYQDIFSSVAEIRSEARATPVGLDQVERHLATLYLPQLIRHVQIALEGMKRAGTRAYVKIGTAGTGGMGLNVPFTHSEERPSRMLLSKAGLAGAQSLFLYLMARTPGAPAVKEIKPASAISWKAIGEGPIKCRGKVVERADAVEALPLNEAFSEQAERGFERLGEALTGVYLDSGENGYFSCDEFETITALGLMEFVTPEEIAENVFREIAGYPTGRDVVASLDASTMGPTYRAGILRRGAIDRMREMEKESGTSAVAYEMLGPPRVTKLLFEAALLQRIFGDLASASNLEPGETAARTLALVEEDDDFRQRVLSVGIPILLPDGRSLLRGSEVAVPPSAGRTGLDDRTVHRGWLDLRADNWARWRERIAGVLREGREEPGVEAGSGGNQEPHGVPGALYPARLVSWILRREEKGERIKR